MRIGIATARGEFELKESLLERLRVAGYNVLDFGAHFLNSGDNRREFVIPLAESIADPRIDHGAAWMPVNLSARQRVDDDHINAICLAKVGAREKQRL